MGLFNKVLQAVLETALPILAAALASWATGKAIEIFKKLRDKNPELYEILKVVCREAVTAAEQVYGGGEGRKKLEYAINFVEKYLAAKGIKLDIDIILGYIEAAVKDMNDYGIPYEYEIVMDDDDEEGEDYELQTGEKEAEAGKVENPKTNDKGKS
ncbi:MAG: phage holin [Bacteroidales bacterium]|nr:phage holin [Bacteroidales bacterium]